MRIVGFEPTQLKQKFYRLPRLSNSGVFPILKLSCGEPIFRFLLDSYSLLTIVHTVTVREPNLIFVPRDGIEPPPFVCKTNTLPLRHRGGLRLLLQELMWYAYTILIILYREMVTLHSIVGYEPSMVLDLSMFLVDIGSSPILGFPPNPSLPLRESNSPRVDQNHVY